MQLKPNNFLQNGKYRIIRVLGQGGFGITYLALHTMLDKQVAIKEFFPKEYCTRNDSHNNIIITGNNTELIDHLRKRFLKEAKNIAKLDHPGIVKIHDVFQENGTAYYVMDYIEGENLSNLVKTNGALTEEKSIEYIVEIGKALEYMHSKKMTHLDIKPANIIINKDTDTAILVDFGLSKLYTPDNENTSTLLHAVSSGFSPIELYNGESMNEFSPQSDVYSLAATMYFLVTNQTPPVATDLVSNVLVLPSSLNIDIQNSIKRAMCADISKRTKSIHDLYINWPTKANSEKRLLDEKIKEEQRIDKLNQCYRDLTEPMIVPFILISLMFIMVFCFLNSSIIEDLIDDRAWKSEKSAYLWYLNLWTLPVLTVIPIINYLYIVWPKTFLSQRFNKITKSILIQYKIETILWALFLGLGFVYGGIVSWQDEYSSLFIDTTSYEYKLPIIVKILYVILFIVNILFCLYLTIGAGIESVKIRLNKQLEEEWGQRNNNIKSSRIYSILSSGLFITALVYSILYKFTDLFK